MSDYKGYTELGADVVVINEAGPFAPWIVQRGARTRKKPRYSIEVHSEPLIHDFDETQLGAGPAAAIRDAISKAIKDIGEFAKPSTQRKREQAAAALNGFEPPKKGTKRKKRTRRFRGQTITSSKSWYETRYAGGRTGFKPPNQTKRLFNDSGRFADGLSVRQNVQDKTFTTNVPANRLNPNIAFGAPERFGQMLDQLRSLVPILQDGRKLLASKEVRDAIDQSIKDLIIKAEERQAQKLQQLYQARKRALLAVLKGVLAVARS